MSDELTSPLTGAILRIDDKEQLDEFLARPDAGEVVKLASFEEIFFTIKHVGLADSLELLPLVSSKQVRGFVDLDCWRKDAFVRRPFMEWVAAFIQAGPEDTVRALSGIDELVIALFLKDVIQVYEIERDDPPEGTQLIFTPDNRFAVEPVETGEPATIGMLILDALFKYYPALGSRILTSVRYTTRTELEEAAYQNKNRRLEVHGFVDYYDALSIYAGPAPHEVAVAREPEPEAIAGEESPGNLPAIFVDSLLGGEFLLQTFRQITNPEDADRFAQELTALGNRILSANLVNLGELDSVRPALEEMRDYLTIGLEHLTGGRPDLGPRVLGENYIQTIFKIGFDQVARLRDEADVLAHIPDFHLGMLDAEDREFVESLRRFKPLNIQPGGAQENFRSMAEVKAARSRLSALKTMIESFFKLLGRPRTSFRRTFNSALIELAMHGKFEFAPTDPVELETWLAQELHLPDVDLPQSILPFAEKWRRQLMDELQPLIGKRLDPRFLESLNFSFRKEST